MFNKEESNICKGIAICMMLMHHLFSSNDYSDYSISFYPFTEERVVFLAILCKICVAVFMFVTGYGLYTCYKHCWDWNGFIRYRYVKLMKTYWFVFIIVLLLQPFGRTVVDAYGGSIKDILFYGVADFSGLAYLFGTPTLNPTWWYMSIAIVAIFMFPIIAVVVRHFGTYTVTIGSILMLYFFGVSNAFTFYIPSLMFGVLCASEGWFTRIEVLRKTHKLLVPFAPVISFFVLLWYRTEYNLNGIVDGLLAVCIATIVELLVSRVRVVGTVLEKLGEHSYVMFLSHTLIYNYYFKDFIYGFKYWWLIFIVLLAISFVVSVVLEFVLDWVQKCIKRGVICG